MKAVRAYPDPEHQLDLRVEDVDTPVPGDGQVLVGITAAGTTPPDHIVATGGLPYARPSMNMEAMSPPRAASDRGETDQLAGGCSLDVLQKHCSSRRVLEHLTGRWGALILIALREGPTRFNKLRRGVDGVSEKMLAQSLHALERDGFVVRAVHSTDPAVRGVQPHTAGCGRIREAVGAGAVSGGRDARDPQRAAGIRSSQTAVLNSSMQASGPLTEWGASPHRPRSFVFRQAGAAERAVHQSSELLCPGASPGICRVPSGRDLAGPYGLSADDRTWAARRTGRRRRPGPVPGPVFGDEKPGAPSAVGAAVEHGHLTLDAPPVQAELSRRRGEGDPERSPAPRHDGRPHRPRRVSPKPRA